MILQALQHFRTPRGLGRVPASVGGAGIARWHDLLGDLRKAGILVPSRSSRAARERGKSPGDVGVDERTAEDVALLAHLVREIGVQLPALPQRDDRSMGARLALARELIESVACAIAESARARVSERRQQVERNRAGRLLRVNLGSGRRPIRGWRNIDVASRDIRQCLQWGLPFEDESVEYVFFAHALEHLYFRDEALAVLREVRRVLVRRGVVRIVVPDLGRFLRAYVSGDRSFFEARRKVWLSERRCRTPLEQILWYSGASLPPHAFLAHKWGYDFETLRGLLHEAGFGRVELSEFMQSRHAPLRIDELSEAASVRLGRGSYSLFVEARP